MGKRLYELIYGSVQTRPFTPVKLSELLTHARAHNQQLDVTGVLLHQNGVFIQVLEGEDKVVSALYDRISRDPRHKNVAVFRRGPIQARQFAGWSMGFVELDAVGDADPGRLEPASAEGRGDHPAQRPAPAQHPRDLSLSSRRAPRAKIAGLVAKRSAACRNRRVPFVLWSGPVDTTGSVFYLPPVDGGSRSLTAVIQI